MSEILGLQWKHITKDKIIINQARVYADGKLTTKSTKTKGSARVISLPNYIYRKIQKLPHDGDYIINLSSNAIRKRFARILDNNDIPHCRFHDLRHANASVMMLLNIPDKYAMKRGGWTTTDVYKNRYVQTFSKEEKEVANTIDSYFLDLVNSGHLK